MKALSVLALAALCMSASAHAQTPAGKTDARRYSEAVFNLIATDVPEQSDISIDLMNRILSGAAQAADVTGSKAQCYVRMIRAPQSATNFATALNTMLHLRFRMQNIAHNYTSFQVKRTNSEPKNRAQAGFDHVMFGDLAEIAPSVAQSVKELQAIIAGFEQSLGRSCGF